MSISEVEVEKFIEIAKANSHLSYRGQVRAALNAAASLRGDGEVVEASDLADLYGGELVQRFKLAEWDAVVKLIVQQAIEHGRRSASPPLVTEGETVSWDDATKTAFVALSHHILSQTSGGETGLSSDHARLVLDALALLEARAKNTPYKEGLRAAALEAFARNVDEWWAAVSLGKIGNEEQRFGWTGALDSHGAMLARAARSALKEHQQ